jgi:hypothetical protein
MTLDQSDYAGALHHPERVMNAAGLRAENHRILAEWTWS